MRRLLLIGFFVEIGFVLAIVPWLPFWERNYFAETLPVVHTVITNHFVRGAVTGLGVVNLAAAIGEVGALLFPRHVVVRSAPAISPAPLTRDE